MRLITMGTPHTGALQSFTQLVEGTVQTVMAVIFGEVVHPRDWLAQWSPGTVQLLDDEVAIAGEEPRVNTALRSMNFENDCFGPRRQIQMIGGDDPRPLSTIMDDLVDLLPNELVSAAQGNPWLTDFLTNLFGLRALAELIKAVSRTGVAKTLSLGSLAVGESPNDGVVPLRSAHAETRSGSTVPTLAYKVRGQTRRGFNHQQGGTSKQPIRVFAQDDIFPVLTDWWTATIIEFPMPELPTQDETGSIRAIVDVEYNAHHENLTGVALVFYGKDHQGKWHILDGADPDSREITDAEEIISNSSLEAGKPINLQAEFTIPRVDPDNPDTDIVQATFLVVPIGTEGDPKAPEDPTKAAFGLP